MNKLKGFTDCATDYLMPYILVGGMPLLNLLGLMSVQEISMC
jgi:hypothetical protein